MHLRVAGKDIIVIDDLEVALELMDKRAMKYSGRPYVTMLRDV